MNRKRLFVIISGVAIILLAFVSIILIHNSIISKDDIYVQTVTEKGVTRYEWIEMLSEQMGIMEYESETPYFSDVPNENIYFPWIQSAVEWGVLDASSNFEGDNYASGYFIARTAMKTIGESKLRIYFNTEDTITEDTYIELAIEHGLITEEQITKVVSKEECKQVLGILRNLYFSEFWKDDYSNVIYQKDVVELSQGNILQNKADGYEIVITDSMMNSLEVGTIIVFDQKNTNLKLAREIVEIDSDETLVLGSVQLDKVVESYGQYISIFG